MTKSKETSTPVRQTTASHRRAMNRVALTVLTLASAGLLTVTTGPDPAAAGSPMASASSKRPACKGKRADYVGTNGPDRIRARRGSVVVAGRGNDRITGRNLTVCAGPGNDLVRTTGRSRIHGGSGEDRLWGGSGDDLINGDGGDDVIHGGVGWDLLRGGRGNDRIFAGPGANRVFGGPGDDRLSGGPEVDWIYGGPGNDRIDGGGGDDRLYG